MPLRSVFKAAFQKAFDELPREKQLLVVKALEILAVYFQSSEAPYGLRVKKLHTGNSFKVFQARASLDLRLVWIQTKEEATFCLLGSHDEVQRFLKRL